MKFTRVFKQFFNNEKAGGFTLIIVTIVSLILANSAFQDDYIAFWNDEIFAGHSLAHWINDGLMTIFFLLIGLELEREVYAGELSNLKKATFPLLGALGGMLVPAAIFLAFNFGTPTQAGAGIPMATDIAFAIGILSLAGKRVPFQLKIFLTALAVIDDLGAIIVIAVFYTASISFLNLGIALSIFGLLLICNRMKIHNPFPYLIGGVAMWFFMLHSGVHATITGVLVAFAIPFGNGKKDTLSFKLEHFLHRPVAFFILPLFAVANTCIALGSNWHEELGSTNSLGIISGLAIGKPFGIFIFAFLGVTLGFTKLPSALKWKHILGTAFLGGIGFTMSIFITLLAYDDADFIRDSKIAIVVASIISAILGLSFLKFVTRHTKRKANLSNAR